MYPLVMLYPYRYITYTYNINERNYCNKYTVGLLYL